MTTTEARRLPGTLIAIDGPGGVGKSTTTARVIELLTATGATVHGTTQPSRTPLGELIRHGTDIYCGLALANLCAGDRLHQLAAEILPALVDGKIVVSDRYVPSSLVLQGLDGLAFDTVWRLNDSVYRPDLAVILNADPDVIARRLHSRGAHSRFERAADSSTHESLGYHRAGAYLRARGWPVVTLDTTTTHPYEIAKQIVDLVRPPHARTCPIDETTEENSACH
jgi:dTMP kinase